MTVVEPRPAPADGEAAWLRRWEDALTALEMDVAAAELLLRAAHLPTTAQVAQVSAWRPPAGLGPLPAPLLTRARTLLDRQLEVASLMAQAAASSRRQLAATRTLRAVPEAVPVYLDAQG